MEGQDLVGHWTNGAATTSFPVHVAPGAVFVPPDRDGGETLTHRARACLADPMCPAEDAERAFVLPDEARDADEACYAFLGGQGARRDLRARACFERKLAHFTCSGSPDNDAVDLAEMRIDGLGGKQDIAGGRALMKGCFEESTVNGVLAYADAKEKDPGSPAVPFCKTEEMTTMQGDSCMARDLDAATIATQLVAKDIAKSLRADGVGEQLLGADITAFEANVGARSGDVYKVFIEGTVRVGVSLAVARGLEQRRRKELEKFLSYVAPAASDEDVTHAERELKAALNSVKMANPDEGQAFAKAQAAWVQFRDAELALYLHVFGPRQGDGQVRRGVLLSRTKERTADCTDRG